jgi:hypothetical protein
MQQTYFNENEGKQNLKRSDDGVILRIIWFVDFVHRLVF